MMKVFMSWTSASFGSSSTFNHYIYRARDLGRENQISYFPPKFTITYYSTQCPYEKLQVHPTTSSYSPQSTDSIEKSFNRSKDVLPQLPSKLPPRHLQLRLRYLCLCLPIGHNHLRSHLRGEVVVE
jgi:hypothetical protein